MKLYLSSYRIPVPEALFGLLPKPPTECTVAVIPNAKDDKLPQERAQSLDELIYDLAKFGFKTEVVDLREYDEPARLREKLQTFPVIFASGGNTFILRSEMKRTGLDASLPELLENGVVYCGESAGAIVVGTTLEGTELADEPDLADEVIMDGLGFVRSIVVPHADSLDFREYAIHMKQKHADNVSVTYLNENQALVVDGAEQKIVSASS